MSEMEFENLRRLVKEIEEEEVDLNSVLEKLDKFDEDSSNLFGIVPIEMVEKRDLRLICYVLMAEIAKVPQDNTLIYLRLSDLLIKVGWRVMNKEDKICSLTGERLQPDQRIRDIVLGLNGKLSGREEIMSLIRMKSSLDILGLPLLAAKKLGAKSERNLNSLSEVTRSLLTALENGRTNSVFQVTQSVFFLASTLLVQCVRNRKTAVGNICAVNPQDYISEEEDEDFMNQIIKDFNNLLSDQRLDFLLLPFGNLVLHLAEEYAAAFALLSMDPETVQHIFDGRKEQSNWLKEGSIATLNLCVSRLNDICNSSAGGEESKLLHAFQKVSKVAKRASPTRYTNYARNFIGKLQLV